MIKTLELISEKKESGDIPPDYKRHFIENLLDRGICICGSNLSDNNEFRKNVQNLLDQCDKVSDISEEITTEAINLKSLKDEIFKFDITGSNEKLRYLQDRKKKSSERLNEVSNQIGSLDVENAKYYEKKRNQYSKLKNDLHDEIMRKEGEYDSANKEYKKLEQQLEREFEKEEQYEELNKCSNFCQKALDAAQSIKDEIMDDFRNEVEENTKRQFFDLIWKKENYKGIKINENYDLAVIHQSNWEGIDTLSAGERQVLALSFMAALNNVSGFDVPIIIDTPLGRISKEPKLNIAENLPQYLNDKQIVLLMTEEEYTPDVRDKLVPYTNDEYKLSFEDNENGAVSKVIPYANTK